MIALVTANFPKTRCYLKILYEKKNKFLELNL